MNSLTSQLESSKSSRETLQETEGQLESSLNKLQQCEEKLKSSTDELTKLNSEKKMLLKHDQVYVIYVLIFSYCTQVKTIFFLRRRFYFLQ